MHGIWRGRHDDVRHPQSARQDGQGQRHGEGARGKRDRHLLATAHAAGAIGGEEPRDGSGSIAVAVLSDSVPVVFQPSERPDSLSCGDDIKSSFFESGEHTVQLRASMGCAHSKVAVKISSSGKTFDFQGFKIIGAATDQIKGSVGILVGATNVTIVGGGTGSTNGIEYFD